MKKHKFTRVCRDCGIVANHLTMLKRHGSMSLKPAFDVSTMHTDICDICGKEKGVAPVRDFYYPAERAMRFIRQYITKGGEK